MSLGSVLFVLALGVIVVLFLARPFLERWKDESKPLDGEFGEGRSAGELVSQKVQVLKEIQDIDLDFALGKIPSVEYSLQRGTLVNRGAALLRQLDEIGIGDRTVTLTAGLKKRGGFSSRQRNWQSDDLEELISARRRSRAGRSPGFCPHCGKPMDKSDRFCSGCGRTVVE